ncbi:MAG: hypothetical protein KGL35_20940 [Bradyrhizobium sp.]|nr:hypothetical protein [Bradyrhizobium sp.]
MDSLPPQSDPAEAATLIGYLWSWLAPTAGAVFGGGVVWGAAKMTAADYARRLGALEALDAGGARSRAEAAAAEHDRRLGALEKAMPDGLKLLGDKMDANHREVVRMIVDLAGKK